MPKACERNFLAVCLFSVSDFLGTLILFLLFMPRLSCLGLIIQKPYLVSVAAMGSQHQGWRGFRNHACTAGEKTMTLGDK